jgi:membrane protein DedA with SNARE-associated domain
MPDAMLPDIFQWFAQFASDARIWVTQTAQAHPLWCFPIAFTVAFTESFVGLSFIIPGFAVLVALGGVIGASDIGLFPALAGAVLGALCGDVISWGLGLRYHHQILHVWPFRKFEAQLEKALHFFHRWGAWAVFFGRFLGPFRATVPLVAGMSELAFRRFMAASIASAIIWAYALLAFPAFATKLAL